MVDVFMTVMYVVGNGLAGAAVLVMSFAAVHLICCGGCAEMQAAAQPRSALMTEYGLAQRSTAAPPAPVEVELMSPVVLPMAAAPAVAKLAYFPYSAEGREASEKLDCAICLEVFEHGVMCSEVPVCQHLFHEDCIGLWMKTKTTCLLCRCHNVPGSERLSAAEDMV